MASTYKLAFEFEMRDSVNRVLRSIGNRFTRTTITPVLGVLFDTLDVIPDTNTAEVLWVKGQGGVDTFDYLFLLSDADVYVELANTVPATDERLLLFVRAGIPLVIPSGAMGGFASNTTRLDGSVLVSATDYNEVTEISVQNDAVAGAGSATVRLMLVG